MTRSTVYKFILLTSFAFLLGFSYNYHLPKLESFLLVELERISQQQSPVRVWAQKLHFHLLPLGVVLEDVKVLADPPLDRYLAPASLKQVGIRLAIWPLLRGEVRLSQIYIQDSELNIFLKNELFENKSKGAKFKIDFEKIYALPIDEIQLDNVRLQGRLDPQNVVFRIADLNLLIENRYQSIFVEMNAPQVLVKPSGPVQPLRAQLELRTLIEAQEMQISAFKLKTDESFVVASGRFNGDLSVGRLDNGVFDARTKLRLSDLNVWENVFFLNPKIPRLEGHAELDVGIELRKGQGSKIEGDLHTHEVKVDKFIVGEVKTHARSDLKTISSDLVHVENSAGKVDFAKLNVTLGEVPSFSVNLATAGLDVHQLLENLSIQHVPIQVPVHGEASCQGAGGPTPQITCQAEISAARVHVDSGRPKFSTVVEVDDIRAKGDVKITPQQVAYKADLQVGKNSTGRSDGVIDFEQGFKINYQGDRVEFADVKNLASLRFEGAAKITGSTEGTTKWATIDMNVDGKNLWLEDYPLGNATAKVKFKAGHLNFENLTGQFGVTRYNGTVGVNLNEDRLRVAGQIPFMDLKDVQSLFQRKVQLPIAMSGTGTGQLEAEGPFRFSDMSYTMRSSFFRGQIANEAFDELVFNVRAQNGLVKSERIVLSKANGVMEVKGQITPKGEIDTVAVGRSLRLEQSENVVNMGLDLQGLADFTVLVRGQLPHPRVELNGRLSKVILGDRPAQDSVFKLNFLTDRVEGSGQFLGTTLLSDFVIPYGKDAPFAFKLKTKKWDFTTLFSLVSRSAQQIDFNTAVSAEVDLKAPTGGLWASSGQVRVNEFVIRKGGKSMVAEKPMLLHVRQGVVNSEDCVVSSGDSYLKLDVAGLTRSALNASLNGKVDLSLLGLFTPFISDLRGNASVSLDLKGTADKPFLSGSAYVDRGYVKFVDLLHPFANVRADILFNDNQILLNAVRADLAGGKVSGEGKVTFVNGKSRPVDVKGRFNDVKLNIPEGYKTQGSGQVAIHGDKFPYAMDITYDVSGGEVVAEFTEQSSGNASVKASAFLPHFLDQDSFHPFNFNLDVNLKSPVLVNNELMRTSVSGHVRASGTPDRLLLNGSFTPLPGGKVFFRDQPFEITSAFVEYTNAPPNDPKIYVAANSRVIENVIDEQGRSAQNQYDVSLLVQGHAQDPKIDLTSQPPLGRREIVSLLALGVTGMTTGAEERNRTTEQSANTSAALGAALLQKAGGKRVKDTFGIDVKVSSSQATTENAAQPMVTLSKQWTPKFGASASSTLETSPNNNVKLEYKLNNNVSAIGSWDGREALQDQQKDTTRNVLGLDLQYKMQFK